MKRWMLTLAVPVVVLVCTGIACAMLFGAERRSAERERAGAAQDAGAVFRDRVNLTVARLSTTSGLFAASRHVDEPEFRQFVRTLVREPTIDTVAYIDRVPASERAAFERRLGFPIVDGPGKDAPRAPSRAEYYPYELTGTAPKNPRVNTPDAAGEPVRAAALRRARDTGRAQTTAAVTTFRDKIRALLVFVPVYEGPIPPASLVQRRATLRGYAVGILPLSHLTPPSQEGSVALLDGGRRIAGARRLGSSSTVPLTLAGRRFELRVATGITPEYTTAVSLAVGGVLLAVMIGAILAILLRRDEYAQRLVKQRLAEQRKAEAALAESERYHRLLAEHASDWIALVGPDGRCTYCSPSVRKVLGREPEDVVGQPFTAFLHPDDAEAASRTLTAIARGQEPPAVELRQSHHDGHWVPLETSLAVVRDDQTGEVTEVRCASRDITERHRLEAELRALAVHDVLTGLPNRRGLSERLESELALARRYGGGALLMIDLDGFKQVNDTLGHSVGDEVLCRVADVLRERVRASDHVARLGGDEFAVLLPRVDDDGATTAAEGVLTALREDAELQRLFGGNRVTASVGIALMGHGPLSADQLLVNADQAMYAAKRTGRDRAAGVREISDAPA